MTLLTDEQRKRTFDYLSHRASLMASVGLGQQITREFSLKEIRSGVGDKGVASWLVGDEWRYPGNQPTLYQFSANDVATMALMIATFPRKKKGEEREYAAPKLNKDSPGGLVIYVGSSIDVKTRLREHLWKASKSTYALNLGLWCPDGEGHLSVCVQPILAPDSIVRQDLEDAVWHESRPAFGKKGSK